MGIGIVRWGITIALPLAALPSGDAAAQARAFTQREVSFENGSVELRGTLVRPSGEAPVPAVVFLHGSGPMTREGFRPYAEELAKLGVASLLYDKRGTGSSGGSWLTASLDDLAGDALAAVHFLEAQDGIDPGRIGFWGISQAGWIAPRAAARSPDVSFMIVISGGGASPRASEMFSYRKAFESAGLSAAEQDRGFGIVEAYFDYLETGTGRSPLLDRLEAIGADPDDPLRPLAGRLEQILPSQENRPNWSWVATYDPAPDIARVRCPVLLMFGDRDTEQPTGLAVQRWREGLKEAGNDDVTVMIFPGAGHGIRMAPHTDGSRGPFADGYAEVMLGWLWRHVVEG